MDGLRTGTSQSDSRQTPKFLMSCAISLRGQAFTGPLPRMRRWLHTGGLPSRLHAPLYA